MNESNDNNSGYRFLNTDGGKTPAHSIEIPAISLPKGGGAIASVDEKFSVNAVNGTSSFSIALPFSKVRGLTPAASLSYNSGKGNGIFGLGWSIDLPSFKRKTDKGLPQYRDSIDSDTFLLSGMEDLVPEFSKNTGGDFLTDADGNYQVHEKETTDGLSVIRYYIPRIESSFTRIERWQTKASGEIRWRTITKDNQTTLFGWTVDTRIADPVDNNRVFEWLPEFVFDDIGNCASYIYGQENETGFNFSFLHNRNRSTDGTISYTNRYLQKIVYGNRTPYLQMGDDFPVETDFLCSTVFDYGEYDLLAPFEKVNDWDFRPDAFSDYKAGFEIRTTRLCRRVLLFHHFRGEGEYDGLVRSIGFNYDTNAGEGLSLLSSVLSTGYIKQIDGSYSQKSLPEFIFEYQQHEWNKDIQSVSADNLIHAPAGLDEQQYRFMDLFNEGLPGILTEQAGAWYYKHNLGDGKFEQAQLISPKPSFKGLNEQWQLADLDADGCRQFVSFSTEPKGYFELGDDNQWQSFQQFKDFPNIPFNDPHARMLDLDGDGRPEILVSEENIFTWYPSAGRDGFSGAQKISRPRDEEAGPYMVFAGETQTIFLADMSGDGLTDIVRIRNGEISYWPNLGYGKFGTRIAMDNAPCFDHPDSFNPSYLRLADIDGTGTTDIIYLGKNKFSCWLNVNGNSFSTAPFEIDAFPAVTNRSKINVGRYFGQWRSLYHLVQ